MGSSAFEILGDASDAGDFLFTCEHASNRLPKGALPSERDLEILEQHWGWDIGASDVVRELVARRGGQAVLSTFSRLWVDPNRSVESAALIVTEIDGQTIDFNVGVDEGELRNGRIREYYEPYHRAIEEAAASRSRRAEPFQLLSIHSFTPLYLGTPRAMEIGVLFNEHDECAWHLEEALQEQGFETVLNAPYSGKPPERLIYSAERHGRALDVVYLELEIRQDLIDAPDKAADVGARISLALDRYLELSAGRISVSD